MTATMQEKVQVKATIGDFALHIHAQLFDSKEPNEVDIKGHKFPVSWFGPNGDLRSVDVPINGKSVRFVQQNPDKDSWCARLAREGHKITWVIVNETNLWAGHVDQPPGEKARWNQKPGVVF